MNFENYSFNAKRKFLSVLGEVNDGVQLDPNDFRLSNPEVSDMPEYDTVVYLKPLLHSRYHGTLPVYYNRTEIDEAVTVEFVAYTETKDLLPAINNKYGYEIVPDDIINEPLQRDSDPYVIQKHTIKFNSDSFYYKGEVEVSTGILYHVPKNPLNVYVFLEPADFNEVKESLIRLDLKGTKDRTFKFLNNVKDDDLKHYELEKVIKTVNDLFYLIGKFTLIEHSSYYGSSTEVNYGTLIVDSSGYLVDKQETQLFTSLEGNYYDLSRSQYRYFIENKSLKRYRDSGLIDLKYEVNFDGTPLFFRTTKNGMVYVTVKVGEEFKIYRLKKNGKRDLTYEVTISGSVNLSIAGMSVDDLGRVYVLHATTQSFSVEDDTPIINGENHYTSSGDLIHSWNPVSRFNKDGTFDKSFAPILYAHNPEAVFDSRNTSDVGSRGTIAINERSVMVMSMKRDGFRGFKFNQPVCYRLDGYITPLMINPMNLPKWTKVSAHLNADTFNIVYGEYQPYRIDKADNLTRYLVWRYDMDGDVDTLWEGDTPIKEVFVVNE